MYRITELGRLCGLSRSTLLYYDRIGLLKPRARSRSNDRRYSEQDRLRLETICAYREKGLSLEDIQTLLATPDTTTEILQRRFAALEDEIQARRNQQRLLADMLQLKARGWQGAAVDKVLWVAMLRAAGMSDAAMDAWHQEFERRSPEGHQAFLESLGIAPEEIAGIREHARLEGATP